MNAHFPDTSRRSERPVSVNTDFRKSARFERFANRLRLVRALNVRFGKTPIAPVPGSRTKKVKSILSVLDSESKRFCQICDVVALLSEKAVADHAFQLVRRRNIECERSARAKRRVCTPEKRKNCLIAR